MANKVATMAQINCSGEFALEFGNYTVEITTPADHIVAATGELQNPKGLENLDTEEY